MYRIAAILFAENMVPRQLFSLFWLPRSRSHKSEILYQINGSFLMAYYIPHGNTSPWKHAWPAMLTLRAGAGTPSKIKKVCSFPQLTLATPCVASNITFLKTRTWFAIILWRGVVALPLFQNLTSLTFPGTDLTRNVYPTAPLSINCSRK